MSAALTLARRGRSVIVFDKDVPGFGASTRNGGQVGSGNQKFRVKTLIEMKGRDKAVALLREGTGMLAFIADLIEREQIQCHFRRCGRFRGAIRPEHYDAMARELDDLRDVAGVESFMVPKSRQHEEIGSDMFYGGSVLPNDASLHPGLYHAGLMRCAMQAGATVVGKAEVTRIEKLASSFRVSTLKGDVIARDVVIATDGYTGHVVPELRRRIVSVGSAIITTGVLPEALYKKLLPKDRVYGNTNRVIYYYRGAPDQRRIVWGGRVSRRLVSAQSPAAYSHLAQELIDVFPELVDTPITHAWDGQIGYSRDEVPHTGKTADGLWYVLGFSGTGVSRATYFGHKVALKVLGDADGRTEFDEIAFNPYPMRELTERVVPVVEGWYRVRDKWNF